MPKKLHLHSLKRRRMDFYVALGRFCGLIACVTGALIGQAELIGEPQRHYLTIGCIAATAAWGYGMHPGSLTELRRLFRSYRN